MIFVGPYLSNPNCHFNMNVIDSIGNEKDLIIDIKEERDYLQKIQEYLKDKNIENEICVYNPFEKEKFVLEVKQKIPNLKIFMYCSDDEWRCFNYDRYLALYVDFFSITANKHLELYEEWGFSNVTSTNWACNPKIFYPIVCDKKYDVTFIGAAYGKRVEYVREAIKNNIEIKVFGKGWDSFSDIKPFWGGYVLSEDINTIINQSKINLNFMWSSQGGYQIKGRNFELSGCNVFQLCNYGEQLLDYFEPKKTIEIFNNKNEFIEKINFYLTHEDEREAIAQKAYEHTMNKHTWDIKFNEVFDFGMNKSQIQTKKFNLLIINDRNVQHDIVINDDRLNIDFEDNNIEYDGVIKLTKNSTINNETLYMMAFSLYCDKVDFVISNFYIDNIWIRIKERITRHKKLIKLIPNEAIMFSSKETCLNYKILKSGGFALIEYPTFEVNTLNLMQSKVLQLLFSSYYQKELFPIYKKNKNVIGMLRVMMEFVSRRIFFK